MRQLHHAFAGLICMLAASAALAAGDPLSEQRALFLEARSALQNEEMEEFGKLSEQLQDYPLYPYLRYEELKTRLQKADEEEISRFLANYEDVPASGRLRVSWLYSLARNKRWQLFLKYYQGSNYAELQCYALQARLDSGQKEGIDEEISKLWLAGKSQPDSCDPLFDFLRENDKLTDELIWQRIRLAMENNKSGLAGYLARQLPPEDQEWVKLWRTVHKRPSNELQRQELVEDHTLTREIIMHAIQRIARFDAGQAHEKWEAIRNRYSFIPQETRRIERSIALSAAWQQHPEAHDWLSALPEDAVDGRVREWRIRTAVAAKRWPAVFDAIANLPEDERDSLEWRYWDAIAREETGRRLEAVNSLTQLAKERDYYGFLAADFLRWPYAMNNHPIKADATALEDLRQRPGFVRAHELYRADLLTHARREWAHAIKNLSAAELKLAALLADQWGWHDRAILTVARSGDFDDLVLRFPLQHEKLVRSYARKNRLDPGHVFAVIRQESAFDQEARSSAGAIGLMQLMPGTGRLTARKNRIPFSGSDSLLEADKNIRIGTSYLRQVMERFKGNAALASAAYNAGPHRVQRWLPEESGQSAANWIAAIPFNETRRYVQRVLEYATIYDWRMRRSITKLEKRMHAILAESKYFPS